MNEKPSKYRYLWPVILYGSGIVGALVSNYLAVTAFLWPVYGVAAAAVGVVFDAAWLGSSWSWISLRSRSKLVVLGLWGGVIAATLVQFWVGWSEAGELGRSVIMAGGRGQNYYMAALAILRHAVVPVIGLYCVHRLGDDLAKLRGEADAAELNPVIVVLTAMSDRVAAMSDAVADTSDRLAVMDDRLAKIERKRTSGSTVTIPGGRGQPPVVLVDDEDRDIEDDGRLSEYLDHVEAGLDRAAIMAAMGIKDRQLRRYAKQAAALSAASRPSAMSVNGSSAS